MFGVIFLYTVGKVYYDLAFLHDRSTWGFALLGVLVYCFGLFVGSVAVAMYGGITGYSDSVQGVFEIVPSILAIPVGLLACWGLYRLLKSQWRCN